MLIVREMCKVTNSYDTLNEFHRQQTGVSDL